MKKRIYMPRPDLVGVHYSRKRKNFGGNDWMIICCAEIIVRDRSKTRRAAARALLDRADEWNGRDGFEPDVFGIDNSRDSTQWEVAFHRDTATGLLEVDGASRVLGTAQGLPLVFRTRRQAVEFGRANIELFNKALL